MAAQSPQERNQKMTDRHDSPETPKFTVIDRRKFRGDDEAPAPQKVSAPVAEQPPAAPRLSLVEPVAQPAAAKAASQPAAVSTIPAPLGEDFDDPAGESLELPPAPSAQETHFQKAAYDKAAERLDDLVRAQNPGAPPAEKIGFEHLVQQLYLSAMMQMGAGTPEGQRPRIDILGARQTIDLLGVVLDKTKGNLTPSEVRVLDTVLYELRMTFLELTRMISAQPPMPPPPGVKR
jgi:hypothetical protein